MLKKNQKLTILQSYWQNEILPMFALKYLREDIGAALAVTFVAIPLSLAIALASNVRPEAALISAVIGGILGATFGGSRLGVTGPAVAMSVLIANTISIFGFTGLLLVGMICGVLQIAWGLLKFGRIAKLIPLSLVLAFTAGIGFLLFFEELPHAFQLPEVPGNRVWHVFTHGQLYWSQIGSASFLLTLLTIVLLSVVPRFLPRAYAFILATLVPMAIVYFWQLPVQQVGSVPHHLLHPNLVELSLAAGWYKLMLTGIEVFILASLETLLSTSAVDLMGKGDLHSQNQDLLGQGIANVGVAVFGGIPVSGIIARSSVNVLAGAKTRRAAVLHALMILAVVYFIPSVIEHMPVAVLAGILLAASFKMMNMGQVVELWKTDRLEVLVYGITFVAIIATDLVDGIQTGLLAAFVIVGFRMFKTKAEIQLWTNNNVLRVGLAGSVTFMSYAKLSDIKDYALSQDETRFVIFEFGNLQHLDAGGASHLTAIAQELKELGIGVIFHNVSDEQDAIIRNNSSADQPFTITITEYEIKAILEKSGVQHSATDVLRHGITKYINHYASDNKRLISTLAQGQQPHTLLITCSDSRLNPNAFFSANIGEIFIVRNVGNVVPPYMPNNIYSEIAAIEYAVHELGVRNIVICGHTECGAIKASVSSKDKDLGYVGLDNWLSIIKAGFRRTPPRDYAHGVEVNLLNQVLNLKTYPLINEMIQQKQITVNAWIYDVHSGHMLEWDAVPQQFVQIV